MELEEPYRTTVMLRYFGDLSSAEIARRQGIPEGTVRSRLKRALDRLRRDLDERHRGREVWGGAVVRLLAPEGALIGGASIAEGVLAMKMILSGAAAAAVIAVGVVGVWQLTTRPDPASPTRGDAARPEAAADAVEQAKTELDAVGEASGGERREAAVVAPKPETDEPAAPAKLIGFAEARLVDELGRALVGATMRVDETTARSGADGRARIKRELDHDNEPVDVRFAHTGLATRFSRARMRDGETVHLGEVVLGPSGTISGQVEDALGRPFAEARVFTTAVADVRQDPGEVRRHGPVLELPVVEATTDANGRFLLEGVAAGFVKVWANAERFVYDSEGPFEVRPDDALTDVLLVLEELERDDRIRGVVLSPEGEPVPNASVGFSYQFANSATASSVMADDQGVFTLTVDHKVPYNFQVTDPEGRWPAIVAGQVEPGDTGLTLQFVETREIRVVVEDRAGGPVEDFELNIEDAGMMEGANTNVSHGALVRVKRDTHTGGVVRVQVPTIPFEIFVDAQGYELGQLGPFEPETVPDPVKLQLAALPGVHGRVLANDDPVVGARVALRATVDNDTLYVKNGFRCGMQPYDTSSDETDEQGRFHLYPRRGGEYFLRVEQSGYATGELGPLAIETSRSLDGLEVELTSGGVIEGRVLVSTGEDPSGVIVGLNHGDGEARTFRTGPDGSYRFEQLASGLWELSHRSEELSLGSSSSTIGPNSGSTGIAWSCEVFADETTFFDLDLRAREPALLSGLLDLQGADATGWTASLRYVEWFRAQPLGSTLTDAEGRFELEVVRRSRNLRAAPGGSGWSRIKGSSRAGRG